MPTASAQRIRFEPFELDGQSGELFKLGHKLNLRGQPIEVLSILLEHPGEVVTREELCKRLWPQDTFVDFEHSLNTAIKKLRQALDDDVETPRYIETLPKRGYRFVGQVEQAVNDSDPAYQSSRTEQPSAPEPSAVMATEPQPPSRSRWKYVLTGGLLLLATIVAVVWFHRARSISVTDTHQLTNTGRHKTPYMVRGVATDGTRVYFAEKYPDKWYLAQVAVAGGEVSRLETSLLNPHVLDISADGTEMLVEDFSIAHATLWIISLPAGSPRRVGDVETYATRFLPGTQQILYSDDQRLILNDRYGAHPKTILTAPAWISHFSISPDRTVVRLTSGRSLWEARIDGQGMHRIFPEFASRACCGSWTADDRVYIFSVLDEHTNLINLWAVSERFAWLDWIKPRPKQLTFGPIPFRIPTRSKNGKRIFALGEQLKGELQVHDEKSGLFSPYLGGLSAGSPDFTRDGQWVTYVSYPEGRLWRSRIDGSERMQLTFPPVGQVTNPRWSPDGKLIVFMEWKSNNAKRVYIVPSQGGSPLLLLDGQFNDPNWAPDGRSLVYSDDPTPDGHLYFMNLDNRQSKQVPGSKGYFAPRWSFDGRYLSALWFDLKKLAIYDIEKDQWRVIRESQDEISHPAFSHDNKYLYFARGFANSHSEIMRIRLADGKLEKAADTHDIETTCSIFRVPSWFTLTPDDRIIVLRDRGSDELYALDLEYR